MFLNLHRSWDKDKENLLNLQYLKRGKLKQTKKKELENGKANDKELD